MTTIREIRQAFIDSAHDEWKITTRDYDGNGYIRGYFESIGWGFWVKKGYQNNERYAWCGVFLAYLGSTIDLYLDEPVILDPDICKNCLPSTQRMVSRAKWRAAGNSMPRAYTNSNGVWVDDVDGDKQSVEQVFQPGVIATVSARKYGDRRDVVGGHFVLVERYVDGIVHTYEGNGRGTLGDGTKGEGVVRNQRPISQFRRVTHFDLSHFDNLSI